jgi:hypothetical protein
MTDPQIEELAANLLSGQRLALTRAYEEDGTWWIIRGTGRGLMDMGLTARSFDGAYLTPLGLRVRAHLQRERAE